VANFYAFYPPVGISGSNASVGVNGNPIPADSTLVGGENPSGNLEPLQVDNSGNLLVSIGGGLANPLPVSDATTHSELLTISGQLPLTLGAHLIAASLAVNIASDQVVPVSASALPLPTGAATSALQTTGNTSLSSIDGKLGSLGQKTMAGSAPIVIASDQSAIPVSGTVTANQGTSPWVNNTSQINGVTPLMGNGVTGTGSQRVTIASDNTAFTVNTVPKTPTAGTVTQAAITVGTSAVRLTVSGSAPSASRSVLVVTPDVGSTATFYVGSATVTNSGSTRGVEIKAGQVFTANNDAGDYYIVSSTATQIVTVMEQA